MNVVLHSNVVEKVVRVEKRKSKLEDWEGIIYPPVSFYEIMNLSFSNAYHQACIRVKVDATVRVGIEADKKTMGILENITPEDSFLALMEKVAYDLELFGNAFLEAKFDFSGKPTALYHVPAQTMAILIEGENLFYVQEPAIGEPIRFLPFDASSPPKGDSAILHLKFYSPLSYFWGMPTWLSALESLRMEQNIKLFHTSFFKHNAVPSMAVIAEEVGFEENAAKKLKAEFSRIAGVENAHKVIIIDVPRGRIRFEKLLTDQKDFSFENLYKAAREEILAAHAVPPRLVGIVSPGHLGGGSEAEVQMKLFKEITIKSRQRYMESKLNPIVQMAGGDAFRFKPFDVWDEGNSHENESENTLEVLKSIEAKLI